MKTLIAAIALTIALPAAANIQAAQPHAGHSQHQGMDHGKDKGCCDHKGADGKPMECCEKGMKDGKMECCDKMGQKGQKGSNKK